MFIVAQSLILEKYPRRMVRILFLNLQMKKLKLRNTEGLAGGHTGLVAEPAEAGQVLRDLELIH